MNLLCLEAAFNDLDGYKSGLVKLATMIKEGGHLVLAAMRRENSNVGFYMVNDITYYDVALKRDFLVKAVEEVGFVMDTEEYFPLPPVPTTNGEGLLFMTAHKASINTNLGIFMAKHCEYILCLARTFLMSC